ncbi:hypothetical protein M3Y94_00222500 [Aphelenchoides besseyi]|nr:hypothetical protein M3Y94_00222500 [Aphelenchoides besseyi]
MARPKKSIGKSPAASTKSSNSKKSPTTKSQKSQRSFEEELRIVLGLHLSRLETSSYGHWYHYESDVDHEFVCQRHLRAFGH